MADVDFEVLNGQEVVTKVAIADDPVEYQFEISVPKGLDPEDSGGGGGGGENIRVVPLLVRTVP